jgi:hypothetical protein
VLPALVEAEESAIVVKSSPKQTAVVELYTSEGCSSCPPADRWLEQLVKVPDDELDVLALGFHVDYWDYIGWKDEFASPVFTQRQRSLAHRNNQSSIYTPEFFVNGKESRGTARVLDEIRKINHVPSDVELTLSITPAPGYYQLQLTSKSNLDLDLQVRFMVFEDDLSNQVKRGENAGSKLYHQRVVRYLSPPIKLKPSLEHHIDIASEWSPQNLGIGALITSADHRYIQSVYTLLPPNPP